MSLCDCPSLRSYSLQEIMHIACSAMAQIVKRDESIEIIVTERTIHSDFFFDSILFLSSL